MGIERVTKEFMHFYDAFHDDEMYPMGGSQPAQVDCRNISCKYHERSKCHNVSPAITLRIDGTFRCLSYVNILHPQREE